MLSNVQLKALIQTQQYEQIKTALERGEFSKTQVEALSQEPGLPEDLQRALTKSKFVAVGYAEPGGRANETLARGNLLDVVSTAEVGSNTRIVLPDDFQRALSAALETRGRNLSGVEPGFLSAEFQKVAVSHSNAWPNLALMLQSRRSELGESLRGVVERGIPKLDPRLTDVVVSSLLKGLQAGADCYLAEGQIESLRTFFADNGAVFGLSKATPVKSNEGAPPKAGGLYMEVGQDSRCRQFTVFVPAEAQEKKAALVEQLNKMSRFTGLTAVDGGTNVVNVILKEADKGRIIDYLRCRGDIGYYPSHQNEYGEWTDGTQFGAVCAAKNLGPGGNDLPLTQDDSVKALPIKNWGEFHDLIGKGLDFETRVVMATSSVLFDEQGKLAPGLYDDVLRSISSGKTFVVVTGRKLDDMTHIVPALEQHQGKKLTPSELRSLIFAYNNCAGIVSADQL